MKQITARRTPDGPWVQVEEDGQTYDLPQVEPPNPMQEMGVSDDEAFEWGYTGSGPRRLAMSILADFFQSPQAAAHFEAGFCLEVIAKQPEEGFNLTVDEIRAWILSVTKGQVWDLTDKGREHLDEGSD